MHCLPETRISELTSKHRQHSIWITTANCGVTRFELRSDGFVRVLSVNDTRHLAGI